MNMNNLIMAIYEQYDCNTATPIAEGRFGNPIFLVKDDSSAKVITWWIDQFIVLREATGTNQMSTSEMKAALNYADNNHHLNATRIIAQKQAV
jgi:hypothetical protein